MLKLFRMEDAAKGIFPVEFIGTSHIDADMGLISTESSPDSSSTLAERDGRTPIFSHQETGPAKRAVYHPNGENSSVGGLIAFTKRIFNSREVIP
jgi:hypothetical protein